MRKTEPIKMKSSQAKSLAAKLFVFGESLEKNEREFLRAALAGPKAMQGGKVTNEVLGGAISKVLERFTEIRGPEVFCW